MSRHTPGPWQVKSAWPHRIKAGKQTICTITSSTSGDEQVKGANARLIAAAPQLAEALELLLQDHGLPNRLTAHRALQAAGICL